VVVEDFAGVIAMRGSDFAIKARGEFRRSMPPDAA
jgi:hypothetical protein